MVWVDQEGRKTLSNGRYHSVSVKTLSTNRTDANDSGTSIRLTSAGWSVSGIWISFFGRLAVVLEARAVNSSKMIGHLPQNANRVRSAI